MFRQIRISFQTLFSHKLRSFLTILGIIFGVAAVIAMMSIGAGAREEVMQQIRQMGINNIFIVDNQMKRKQHSKRRIVLSRGLNQNDVTSIQDLVKEIKDLSIIKTTHALTERMGEADMTEIIGISPDYFKLMNLEIVSGRMYTDSDYSCNERICIIGQEVKRIFFKLSNPIGKKIQLNKLPHTVIGIIGLKSSRKKSKSKSKGGERIVDSFDESIFLPYESLLIRRSIRENSSTIDKIILSVNDEDLIEKSAELINKILLRRHYYTSDFNVVIPKKLLQQQEDTQKVFNIVMVSIAGISLLVGGIGIMNIMLANVLERTGEIGLRRAMGATMRNIRNQFLLEAIILTVCGGLIGVLLGYLLTFFISYYAEWKTAISFISVVLSFGISSLVGVVFGYYPAVQASQLNPIEALRHE